MHINPFRLGGAYYRIFSYWQRKQYVTRAELRQLGFKDFDINAVLSPREIGKTKGIAQGNSAAKGHIFYAEKRGKIFRLRWRREQLEPLKRTGHLKVELRKVVVKRNVNLDIH